MVTDEMVEQAWRDGYDTAASMVATAAAVIGGRDGKVIRGVGRTLARVRDDAEANARERRAEERRRRWRPGVGGGSTRGAE